MKKTLLAAAVLMAFTNLAGATSTDYSNKVVDTGISVIDDGNSISGDNLKVTGCSYVEPAHRKDGIYIGKGSSGHFGGDFLEVKFHSDDATQEFAGIQVNGRPDAQNSATAVFDSERTVIDVSGKVGSGKWGFGLLVNGNGTETASAKFTGGSVFVKTTTEDYTSQSVTVKGNATLDFSNHGDVEIHSYSKYGVTVVDAPGQLTFNNDGTVLLKGKVLPGDKTAQTNVVGIQGESGTWKVTEKVKELKIDLDGAGVDNDGTSYSTGTKAIAASKVDFDVQAQKFTITMNVDPGVEDDSPGAHTSEEVYGIYADKKSTITIGANTATSITVETGLGKGYGIVSTGGAKVAVAGDANVVIDGTQESVALTVNGEGSTLTLAGKQNQIVGDVRAKEQGALGFVSGNTSVAGAVAVDAASTVTLDKASVELAEGSTMKVEGALASTDGVIVLNDAAAGTLSVASLTDGSTLDAVASGSLNDKLGGDLNAFSEAVSITDGAEGTTLVMKEGLVAGEKTAQLTEEGKIDESTVTEKTNSIMESSLEMVAAMPLAMNRMLTTDLRKRMGDLRTSNAAHGAWARYDGGKLSGDSGLDSEFHTIQVGIDTVATPDAPRVGVAFAYTDGEMDYVRSSSDMQGYSLAGYATWMADNGMFLDTVVRMSKFDNDMTVGGSMKGEMDSLAIGVSAEGGWRVDLSSMFYVEPQAEVVYTYINSDDFTLGEARYEVEGLDSLTGRLGFASGIKCPNNKGDVYLRASVVHEFLGDSRIKGTASGSTGIVEIDGKDTWVEYGLGANFNLTPNTYFWADVERTSGGWLDEDWRATVGVRHAF